MLVVAAFLSTLLFGYLFQWTATARAVRPMLERHRAPSSIELSLIRKVPQLAAALVEKLRLANQPPMHAGALASNCESNKK